MYINKYIKNKLVKLILCAALFIGAWQGQAMAQIALPSIMSNTENFGYNGSLLSPSISSTSNPGNLVWSTSKASADYVFHNNGNASDHAVNGGLTLASQYIGVDASVTWLKGAIESYLNYKGSLGFILVPGYWSVGGGYSKGMFGPTYSGGTTIRVVDILYLGFVYDYDDIETFSIKRHRYSGGVAIAGGSSSFSYRLEGRYTFLPKVLAPASIPIIGGQQLSGGHIMGAQFEMVASGFAFGADFQYNMNPKHLVFNDGFNVMKVSAKLGYVAFAGLRLVAGGSYVMYDKKQIGTAGLKDSYEGSLSLQYGF